MPNPVPNDSGLDIKVETLADVPPLNLTQDQDLSGVDVMKEIKGKYLNDPVFSRVVEKPKEHKNFLVEDDLIYINEAGKTMLCIPNVKING